MAQTQWRQEVSLFFGAALRAVDPAAAVLRHLRREGRTLTAGDRSISLDAFRRVVLLGAGKAGVPMARAAAGVLGSDLDEGLVIVKDGHGGEVPGVTVLEGSHPLPSDRNAGHSARLLDLARGCGEDTLVLLLVSGGGSALLPAPVEGVSLADKTATTSLLLGCGATIAEINCVRKHLSRLKGGGLARALGPATTVALVLSDVVGDRLDTIASGPTAPDTTTYADAWAAIERHGVADRLPPAVALHLREGLAGRRPETLKAGDPVFQRVSTVLVGTNRLALTAAADEARSRGWTVEVLSSTLEGEAREVARVFLAILRERRHEGRRRHLILGGGETTVTLRGPGKGGRCQEFALAAVGGLGEEREKREDTKKEKREEKIETGCFAAGLATDGTDGPTDAAGAWADGDSLDRARAAGLDLDEALARNDAYHFFRALGDLVMTGPTGTNVCDLYLAGLA